MTRSRIVSGALIAAAVAAGCLGPLSPIAPALAAEGKGPTARPEVGKPVQEAQALIKAGKFREALAQLQAADAVSGKTAYESYIIEATRESALLRSQDYAGAIRASQALIASGQLPPGDVVSQYQVQLDLNYQLKNYPGVIEAANHYYQAGGQDPKYRQLVAQAYYLQNDYANAAKTLRQIIQTNPKPSEDQLKMLMGIEYKQNPTGQGYIETLEKLVTLYPQKSYWHDAILAVQKKPGFSDKLQLDVAKLKIAAGTADNPNDYMETAQVAIQEGFPGEAKQIMDKGYVAGVLGQGAEAARQKRLQDMASGQAASDERTLAQNAAQAHSQAALRKLGDSYASYGQYDNAIKAYQQAIAAGGDPFETNLAKLHLGEAYLNSGNKAKAKETFKSVTGSDGTQDLAQLWSVLP